MAHEKKMLERQREQEEKLAEQQIMDRLKKENEQIKFMAKEEHKAYAQQYANSYQNMINAKQLRGRFEKERDLGEEQERIRKA